jgi:DNA-binding beta-propeller fold protein YncE/mono/diheme cytochrome c family protein
MAVRLVLLAILCVIPFTAARASQPYPSPLAVVVDPKGETAFVALHGTNAVAVVDLKAGKVLKEIAVDAGPYDLAATADTVYVSCSRGDSLVLIDRAKWTVRTKIAVGQDPRGIAVDEGYKSIFVACHDGKFLQWFDLAGKPLRAAALQGFPDRIAAVSGGGTAAALEQDGSEWRQPTAIQADEGLIVTMRWMDQTSNARAIAAFANSNPVVVHQRPRNHLPATQIAQGWVFVNSLTRSFSLYEFRPSITLDEPQRGFADPSDVVGDAKRLYIASAGTDQVLFIDSRKLADYTNKRVEALNGPANDPALAGYRNLQLPDDLTATRHFALARIPVGANPRRLGLSGDGKTLVVSNHLGDSLTVIDTDKLRVVRTISLGGPKHDAARRGEILFNSAKLTFSQQFTCASCHPNGGSDGLNWDLPRDGVGNFVQTRSLLGVRHTAPYGWHGTSKTLADRVRGTLETLHQYKPSAAEVDAIAAYLETLEPPRLLPVQDKKAVARGKALFEGKAQCNKCHRREMLDDELTHDIGTRAEGDLKAAFDTPPLHGVARTAPYLHDGRAATLTEVFSKHNPAQRHGAAHTLTAEEMADLVEYLKSL